jgi:RES domain-containing protein
MINVPIPGPEPKPPPMPPPPFPGQKPVREPDPPRLPDEEPLPNPDENDEPPQHAGGNMKEAESTFSSPEAFDDFAREIGACSRYIRSPESECFLQAVAATCRRRSSSIERGTIFWRAQVGHGWEREGAGSRKVPGPHSRERMKPLHDRAYEGRINPKGIPCLYFATSRDVAISEVRPWLGSAVTVARFRTVARMELVDCTWHDGSPRQAPAMEVENKVWAAIDRAFSRPVIETDNKAEYAATQAIAEVFREVGFDGVVYRSAYAGDGRNVALFDLEAAEVIDQALFEICDIRLDFREFSPEDEAKENRAEEER